MEERQKQQLELFRLLNWSSLRFHICLDRRLDPSKSFFHKKSKSRTRYSIDSERRRLSRANFKQILGYDNRGELFSVYVAKRRVQARMQNLVLGNLPRKRSQLVLLPLDYQGLRVMQVLSRKTSLVWQFRGSTSFIIFRWRLSENICPLGKSAAGPFAMGHWLEKVGDFLIEKVIRCSSISGSRHQLHESWMIFLPWESPFIISRFLVKAPQKVVNHPSSHFFSNCPWASSSATVVITCIIVITSCLAQRNVQTY